MEGLQAYANKQILHQKELAATFRELWKTPLADIDSISSADNVNDTTTGMNNVDADDSDDDSDDDGESRDN